MTSQHTFTSLRRNDIAPHFRHSPQTKRASRTSQKVLDTEWRSIDRQARPDTTEPCSAGFDGKLGERRIEHQYPSEHFAP
jgi:hypothetical protein